MGSTVAMDFVGEAKCSTADDPPAEISDESKPKEHEETDYRNHRAPGQYTYQPLGIEMICFAPADYLDNDVRNLELRDDDVIIAAYPKTGNTWMQEILWLILNDADTETAKKSPTNDRVPFLEYSMHGFSGVKNIESIAQDKSKHRVFYTHLPQELAPKQVREKPVKVVSMLRNPLDTMVSYYHFCRSYCDLGNFKGDWDDFYHLYTNEKTPYGHVIDHDLSWWKVRDDVNIIFVRFEDLLTDPKKEIARIAEFCGVTLTEEQCDRIAEASRFDVMKNNPMTNRTIYDAIDQKISPFMRKGVSGDWKNYFSSEQHAETCERAKLKMKGSGLAYPCME